MRLLFRVLSFRFTRQDLMGLTRRHLVIGLTFTLLAGVGRYWDHPNPHVLQMLGLGSVIYVFALAALIHSSVRLLSEDMTYFRVLTFVTLTSPPALLYALPVEQWMTTADAITLNLWFLGLVAFYRLLLLATFIGRMEQLGPVSATVVALTPVLVIIVLLGVLNLERATFEIMGGLREPNVRDRTYEFIVSLTVLSFFAAPVCLGVLYWIVRARRGGRRR